MRSLYVYYKVNPDQFELLSPAILAMQARLRALMPGLAAHLWQRSDRADDSATPTWMEVYQFNGHADDRAWAALDDAMMPLLDQLPAGIVGDRHREQFLLVPPLPTGHGG
jgi:hypothetical protein